MKKYSILMSLFLIICSCSSDESDETVNTPQQSTCENNSNGLNRTFCCMEGPIIALPDDVISVTYFTSIGYPQYNWEVLGGSIVLVEGGNSATAKFRIEKNFVRDTIVGESYSVNGMEGCSDFIVITSGNN